MTDIRMILAENMKKYRKIHKISQEKLAEKIGTAPNYIAMIEVGKKFPSASMLERIALALNVDAPDLFSTANYPAKSTSELKNELLGKFDQFLSAVIKEVERKN